MGSGGEILLAVRFHFSEHFDAHRRHAAMGETESWAEPMVTSMIRPLMNGPRSLIVTTSDLPFVR